MFDNKLDFNRIQRFYVLNLTAKNTMHIYIYECCKGKGKGKGHPITGHEDPVGEKRCSFSLSLSSALDGGG
jgi:hypothetical protein